jgi:hypothetical protein
VEVTNMVRASSEIHCNGKTYENGMVIKYERYTGVAETLVLFVETFRFKRNDAN